MKHNAAQFELFPPTRPAVGQLVHLMAWDGRKWKVERSRSWRVISPALYYLLSGDDPEHYEDEAAATWHGCGLEADEIPLLSTELREPWGWKHAQSDYLRHPMITTTKPEQIARGY